MDSRSTQKPQESRNLRAALVLHGLSYETFAKRHGFKARTVKAAVRGERRGKISQAIAEKILSL